MEQQESRSCQAEKIDNYETQVVLGVLSLYRYGSYETQFPNQISFLFL